MLNLLLKQCLQSSVTSCPTGPYASNAIRLWRVRSSGLYRCLARRELHVSEEHCLHPQGQLASCFWGFLVGSIFDTEDNWYVLRNVGISLNYTALQPEGLHSPLWEPQIQSPVYTLPFMWWTKFCNHTKL
jgi:hypothetical protein